MSGISFTETAHICPHCGALVAEYWDTCRSCGFDFINPQYNYKIVKPNIFNFLKIFDEMDSKIDGYEEHKWFITQHFKSNYNISLFNTFLGEMLDYLSYLSGGDNIVDDREVFFINSLFDTTFTTQDIINAFTVVHGDINNKLPLSFYWLYEYELYKFEEEKKQEKDKSKIKNPNDFYSMTGVTQNKDEKIEPPFYLVRDLYLLYKEIGELFIMCDGNVTDNEVHFLKLYTDALDMRLTNFKNTFIKSLVKHLDDKDHRKFDNLDIIQAIEEEHLFKRTVEEVNDENNESSNSTSENQNISITEDMDEEKTLNEYIDELNKLIGLDSVKNDVNSLINLIQVRQVREQRGMKQPPMSLHLVFSGNPGTGKTTVARLLSKIYHKMGLLSKGHLIETDRSGLVGGYIGQTAIKTQEVIQKAMGGILFIDEAYTLSSSKIETDYGQESIDTILKAMEDNRDNLIVIVAGYPNLMQEFLQSNPGLQSRFNKFIYFNDYNAEELYRIFKIMCEDNNLILEDKADEFVKRYFIELYNNRSENFANGRDVRNLFENVLSNQANRIASNLNISDEELSTLKYEDFK